MTLEEMLAREGIRKTIHGYNAAGDARDGEAFVALFADDAVLEFGGFGPVPGFHSAGIDAIRARTTTWSEEPGKDPSLSLASFIRHNLTTCRVVLNGPDSASARTYFIVLTDIGMDHAGTYTDRLIRQGGDWLFAHRRIALDWRSPDSIFPPLK
jgi:hypothetical protein